MRKTLLSSRAVSLAILAVSVGAVGAAYLGVWLVNGAAWPAWLMAVAVPAALVAVMALGASHAGGLGIISPVLVLTYAVLAGGFLAALALRPATGGVGLWLGLPPRAAIVLYGIGVLPFLFVPLAYAFTFDESRLAPDPGGEEDVRT